MAHSQRSTSSPIFVGLKGKSKNGYGIITIHKIHHWTNNNGIFITSYDAENNYDHTNAVTRPISDYVALKPLDKTQMRKGKNYFAVFRNNDNDYTSIYYECELARHEQDKIRRDRRTILIKYNDNDDSDNEDEDVNDDDDIDLDIDWYRLYFTFEFKDYYLPSIIDGTSLTGLYFN